MSAATLAAHDAVSESNKRESEKLAKEMEEFKKKLTPDELAKYEKENERENAIVTLIATVLILAVSAFVLWLFI